MFIKITKNAKGASYYHLVESYREKGKVKQRTLLSLGKVEDGKLKDLADALSKHLDTTHIFDIAKSIDVKDTYILGPLLVLERMMETLGINQVLKIVQDSHERLQFDFAKVVFTQICARFVKPVSKLSLYDHWLERLYPVMIDHDTALQHIYRSLDILAAHKQQIETHLYHHGKDLFSLNVDVVLYDLTTLRFESTRTDLGELRQFGYSKEMRSDCTQVVLGLLTDTEGIPLCFEVHPGNTFEGNTLQDIVDKMKQRFSVRRFIFIADRGLFSAANLHHIRSQFGEFIIGMKMGNLAQKNQQQLYDLAKFTWIYEGELAVYKTTHGEDTLIVTWSKSRAERDRRAREDILDKIRKKLASGKPVSKSFITNSNYKKYLDIPDGGKCTLNKKTIQEQAAKDGFFAVITNVTTMSATELVSHYKQLWKIEDAFGEVKGTLKARPMFHWTDKRIIGHLVLCYLAYYCEAHLTKILRQNKDILQSKSIEDKTIKQRALTVVQAMNELVQVMAVPVNIKHYTYWVRTDIPHNAQALIKAIGMRIPPKLLQKPMKM
jgi:transposase